MNEVISIVRHATGWEVDMGRYPHSRLFAVAPGLEVYVQGSNQVRDSGTIANIAMNECEARHIPISSLVLYYDETKTGGHTDTPDMDGNTQKPLLP